MQNTTVVGIIVAVIIILWGLRIILRKPDDARPSLETPLQLDADTQLPIIPRHVRDQLQGQTPEPETAVDSVSETATENQQAVIEQPEIQPTVEPVVSAETSTPAQDQPKDEAKPVTETPVVEDVVKAEEILDFNQNIETAEIKEFEAESTILDKHLHEQQRNDDESSLANAASIIALNVYPNPRKALSGDKTLKVLLKYGLRYGELSCFHRYEESEESNTLLFSVLRITPEGPCGFDLEALSVEQVQGLAFFLALPHKDVQKGFDTMASIAGLIAREIDGAVYDENNLELTPQLKEHWRHKAIDYRAE
ncbi:cell division protein ZipA C-terminal FtsZ-binding domain-containing protein [Acinetobacter rudis]|uniref:Cell division protein ZipA n=1 Tax=Acinetobacter rudis CIP 110305 TaxID=421052 RepID=S3NNC8_9GAMM|nr:cell division protein ZipA C-terminal FtsZ-binding domain-containing protein [Acinetobacter rudis]EPF79848.1 cell division protein ZipA [Acinetobacter rudis CIP 110305]